MHDANNNPNIFGALFILAVYGGLLLIPGCFTPNSADSSAADAGSSTGTSSSSASETTESSTEGPGHTSRDDTPTTESSAEHGTSTSEGDSASSSTGTPLPACDDASMNGEESDVDCGGPSCAPCPNGSNCSGEPGDCASSFCGSTGQCEDPRSCNALHDSGVATSGVFAIDPDGVGGNERFDAYCRMDQTGGWTLIAMVNHADQDGLAEPNGWFASVIDPDELMSPVPVRNQGLASHGAYRFIGAMEPTTLVEFEVFAEDDIMQTARWFKTISSPHSFQAWFDDDDEPSVVCSDVDMLENCSAGAIAFNGDATYMGGMTLSHYGYTGSTLHMRDDDDAASNYSGICSHTFDSDGNAWHDDYASHWGNGLRIWFR